METKGLNRSFLIGFYGYFSCACAEETSRPTMQMGLLADSTDKDEFARGWQDAELVDRTLNG